MRKVTRSIVLSVAIASASGACGQPHAGVAQDDSGAPRLGRLPLALRAPSLAAGSGVEEGDWAIAGLHGPRFSDRIDAEGPARVALAGRVLDLPGGDFSFRAPHVLWSPRALHLFWGEAPGQPASFNDYRTKSVGSIWYAAFRDGAWSDPLEVHVGKASWGWGFSAVFFDRLGRPAAVFDTDVTESSPGTEARVVAIGARGYESTNLYDLSFFQQAAGTSARGSDMVAIVDIQVGGSGSELRLHERTDSTGWRVTHTTSLDAGRRVTELAVRADSAGRISLAIASLSERAVTGPVIVDWFEVDPERTSVERVMSYSLDQTVARVEFAFASGGALAAVLETYPPERGLPEVQFLAWDRGSAPPVQPSRSRSMGRGTGPAIAARPGSAGVVVSWISVEPGVGGDGFSTLVHEILDVSDGSAR